MTRQRRLFSLLPLLLAVLMLPAARGAAAELAASASEVTPLGLGDQIPRATVHTLDGNPVELAQRLTGKKSVLIVFRGGWCPFCTRHLAGLQSVVPRLRELGYTVYALAPDTAESVQSREEVEDVEVTFLLDPDLRASRALGLAFVVDEETVARYRDYGIRLLSPPDSPEKVLPVPALYVVSADGTIEFAHWEADYKKRLDPEDVLAVAEGRLRARPVTYRHGETSLRGYLAYDPSRTGKRPGVLVIHEWWGLNDYAKWRCRQLAALGYVALAADMYGGGLVVDTSEEAARQAGALRSNRPELRARAAAGLDVLKKQPEVDAARVAAIGYCFGGGSVLELARSGARLNGVVSFHGNLDTPHPEATPQPEGAVLVCHGAADPHVPPEDVEAFRKEMHGCNADWQLNMYGGAVHTFTNPDAGDDPSTGSAYDAKADQRSWSAMQRFFDEIFQRAEP